MKLIWIKNLSFYFISAIIVGAGISLGAWLILAPSSEIFEARARERMTQQTEYREYIPGKSGLVVMDTDEVRGECSLDILGDVKNTSDSAWELLKFKAEFFNSDGIFIDECRTSQLGMLLPGNSSNFKIECGSCLYPKIPEYESYNVEVADAYYVFKDRWNNEPNNTLQGDLQNNARP